MPTFTVSRLSSNDNALFPDKLEIDAVNITYYKGYVLGYKTMIIARCNIASVSAGTGIFFADVHIESTGRQRFDIKKGIEKLKEKIGFKKKIKVIKKNQSANNPRALKIIKKI